MATGANDANGIWQYGEDDSNTTFSALLNRLGASTSTAIGLIKNNAKGVVTATSGGTNGLTYAGLSSNITASAGTTVDAFSMSFTGVAGRLYKATFMAYIDTSINSGRYELRFTNSANTTLRYAPDQTNTLWARAEKMTSYIFTASGATTIKLRFGGGDGSVTIYGAGSPDAQAKFVIEDIGAA